MQVLQAKSFLKASQLFEQHLDTARQNADEFGHQSNVPTHLKSCIMSIYFASSKFPDVEEIACLRAQLEKMFSHEELASVLETGEDGKQGGVELDLVEALSTQDASTLMKVAAAQDIMRHLGCTVVESEALEKVKLLDK
jgi:hypothetical protein